MECCELIQLNVPNQFPFYYSHSRLVEEYESPECVSPFGTKIPKLYR